MEQTENVKMMEDFRHIGHMLCRKHHHGHEKCRGDDGKHEGGPPKARERVLRTLGEHPDGINQSNIAMDLGIRPQSLSELMGKLESDELIKRQKNPIDKRETLVFLTEKGKLRQKDVENRRRQQANALFTGLTEEELQNLRSLLDKILDVVNSEDWCQ